ncbi:MAG TPA: transcriptional repressor LexA [Bacillota bacterium]|nr:transcriptional repressor LexA [Bacillota bacterium]
MRELSHLENEIYKYICDSIENNGFSPSVRDICAALGIKSTSTAHSYIDKLAAKGFITKKDGKSRTLSVPNGSASAGDRMLQVPIIGRVPAGTPILAQENYDGYVDFPHSMSHGASGLFGLRVVGTSMINAGILDGDIVIVQSIRYADNGEIVVAMINDEATVKRLYRENGHIRLQPENPDMMPIITKDVTVLGRVIANFRFY